MEAIQVTKSQRLQTGFVDIGLHRYPPGWNNETEKVKAVSNIEQIDPKSSNAKNSDDQNPTISSLMNKLENNMSRLQQVGLQFTQHKESGRTIIRVVDSESHKVIREIPQESFLDLVAKLDQMVGILFDQRV